MPESPDGRPRVYRRNESRLLLPVIYLAPIAIFAFASAWTNPAFAVGIAAFVYLGYRTLRIGVFVDQTGVTVRDIWRTRRIAWSEVSRFDWGRRRRFATGGVYTCSGKFIAATALSPPFEFSRGTEKAVPAALAGLNDELARHRPRHADAGDAIRSASAPSSTDQLSLPTP